ncbi:GntR family transcriptional regulator [Streptomyces sasae]|uniref:GntR family transcriptional regulator n=1 Tax=Streptomyces sasae TaxID=1266772 RepID=UPI00293113F4|nr:GntR family transcriptional regulator [Streptomyces sasae]
MIESDAIHEIPPSTKCPEVTVDRILQAVVKHEVGMGPENLISESEISRMLGVDRTLIRQALAALYRVGLVGQRPGAGVWIWPVSVDRLQRMTLLRRDVETLSIDYLISADPQVDVSRLAPRHEELRAAVVPGQPFELDAFIREDTAFHAELVSVGRYPLGVESVLKWGRHARVFFAVPEHHNVLAGSYVQLAAATEQMFESLKARDPNCSNLVESYFDVWWSILHIDLEDGTLSIERD